MEGKTRGHAKPVVLLRAFPPGPSLREDILCSGRGFSGLSYRPPGWRASFNLTLPTTQQNMSNPLASTLEELVASRYRAAGISTIQVCRICNLQMHSGCSMLQTSKQASTPGNILQSSTDRPQTWKHRTMVVRLFAFIALRNVDLYRQCRRRR